VTVRPLPPTVVQLAAGLGTDTRLGRERADHEEAAGPALFLGHELVGEVVARGPRTAGGPERWARWPGGRCRRGRSTRRCGGGELDPVSRTVRVGCQAAVVSTAAGFMVSWSAGGW